MARPLPILRERYRHFRSIDLRWNDVDRFGHVNNAVFFELFDTAVNLWLADVGLFQKDHEPICVVARHACDYFFEIKQSDKVEIALAIETIGSSSLTYRPALFRIGDAQPAAQGSFIHVAIDRKTRRPTPIGPEAIRICETIIIAANN